jgi:hypothetical protein
VAATIVTKPDTVREVFHFGVTRCVSKKKNAVAATRAIEIIQKEIPTISSDLRSPPPPGLAANVLLVDRRPSRASPDALEIRDFGVRFIC